MNIYIDNNVLIDHEENKDILPIREDLRYYYSYIHIDEMIELGDKLEEKKSKRLEAIRVLTKGKCLLNNDDYEVTAFNMDPDSIFSICLSPSYSTGWENLKELQSQFEIKEKRDAIIKILKIDVRRLNNYSVNELVQKYGADLYNYVNLSSMNTQTAFQSLFNFLDMIGFWADKFTAKSNMARCYDANHAYFASYCNYFVTNDKRTMNKANVAYQLWGYKTIAISKTDFVSQALSDL